MYMLQITSFSQFEKSDCFRRTSLRQPLAQTEAIFKTKLPPPYALAGFDPTTHSSNLLRVKCGGWGVGVRHYHATRAKKRSRLFFHLISATPNGVLFDRFVWYLRPSGPSNHPEIVFQAKIPKQRKR
jgi:hypothetical protein